MKKVFLHVIFSIFLICSSIVTNAASNGGSFVGGGSFKIPDGLRSDRVSSSNTGETESKLNKPSSAIETEKINPYSEETKEVQELLNVAGYDCGTPDGIMGDNTRNAILNYQKNNGLDQTGRISDELIKYLNGIDVAEEELKKENLEYQSTIAYLEDVNDDLEREVENLETEKAEQDMLVATLSAENTELKEKVSSLETQIEELQKKIEELESGTVTKETETESTKSKTSAGNYNRSSNNSSSKKSKTIAHTCEASGCYKEGTKSVVGISGLTEWYCQSHYNEMVDMLADMIISSDSSSSSSEGYGYDPSDPYYSANDHDSNGKITDEEFQDAMSDAILDMLLTGEY